MPKIKKLPLPSSFRDPNGFVFSNQNQIYRVVKNSYKNNYDHLTKSGLYKKLVKEKLLISHKELPIKKATLRGIYKIIKPLQISFISYPYEWSFSQLKDAALATLKIQEISMEFNMHLKDSSAYNIQFLDGMPILIDTLSFQVQTEPKPWIAYRQFCQHFLAPLALMAKVDVRLNQLIKDNLDGIPLDLTSKLLPKNTFLSPGLAMHIHLHAKAQESFKTRGKQHVRKFSPNSLKGITSSLKNTVTSLKFAKRDSIWTNYYSKNSYTTKSFSKKKHVVGRLLRSLKPRVVWDIGCNTGEFSIIAAKIAPKVISFDSDPTTVESLYLKINKAKIGNILPLVIDITNPSQAIGWENKERDSFLKRANPDCILALALIHHLAITNNLPLSKIASFFANLTKNLIIEFIPKNDTQVDKLLQSREDIFNDYTEKNFEKYFNKYFKIMEKSQLQTKRLIYFMEKR